MSAYGNLYYIMSHNNITLYIIMFIDENILDYRNVYKCYMYTLTLCEYGLQLLTISFSQFKN